jgi:hypothetical protein
MSFAALLLWKRGTFSRSYSFLYFGKYFIMKGLMMLIIFLMVYIYTLVRLMFFGEDEEFSYSYGYS